MSAFDHDTGQTAEPRMFSLWIAERAWAPRKTNKKPGLGRISPRRSPRRQVHSVGLPRHALVIDTETTTDETQALLYGCYRYLWRTDAGHWTTVAEGLIYGDDLPHRDPQSHALLAEYARTHAAHVDLATTSPVTPDWRLGLLSRQEFTHRWMHRVGVSHGKRDEPAVVVFFNAPFDLSRLAVEVGEGREDMKGGFSFTLWTDTEGNASPYRPRVTVKNLDSKRALKKYRAVERGKPHHNGHLLDLRTAVFALTGASHTLDSACALYEVEGKATKPEFGVVTVEGVDYCRQDVRATADLFAAVVADYEHHPIDLQLTQAYSPASVVKSYLARMGITPPLAPGGPARPGTRASDPWVLGVAMSAFYGGRAECRIRKTPLPVQLVDYTSMYPSVNALMGVWQLVTAADIQVIEDNAETARLQAFLDALARPGGAELLFDPVVWPNLCALVEFVPNGDIVPIRAAYRGNEWAIGINHLHGSNDHATHQLGHEFGHWFTLGDAAASVLLTGTAPRLTRVLSFRGIGQQDGLRPVALRGDTETVIDPAGPDFFRFVIEERQHRRTTHGDDDPVAAFLKVFANAGGYGIYAEMIRREQATDVEVYCAGRPMKTKTAEKHPEQPGRYCYPPLAASATGAARLMLALLEHEVTNAGGSWVFCDTDSMAIVATETGMEVFACDGGNAVTPDGKPGVRALSFADVNTIRHKFNRLNPYDPACIPDLLKAEESGMCLAISAKRYAIYEERPSKGSTEIEIRKASEHGLGHLLDPNPDDPRNHERDLRDGKVRPWIADTWRWIIRANTDPSVVGLAWFDRPALARYSVSSWELYRAFTRRNTGKPWAQRIKPANFLRVPTLDAGGMPEGSDETRFRLIAPYGDDDGRDIDWLSLRDPDSPPYRITTTPNPDDEHTAGVKDYGWIIREYRNHPETKFTGADGERCGILTRGLLSRMHVSPTRRVMVGKETNRIESIEVGLDHAHHVTTAYDNDDHGYLIRAVLPLLAHLSGREMQKLAGCDRRTVDRIRQGQMPHRRLFLKLCDIADGLNVLR